MFLIAAGVAFTLTWMFGFKDAEPAARQDAPAPDAPAVSLAAEPGSIYAPVSGSVVPHTEIADATFASGALGAGIGIHPATGEIVAPFDGEIVMFFPTRHAIGLKSNDGIELLIHVGINTVELEGKHFTALKEAGETVKAGDRLLAFDKEAIQNAGYDVTTAVLVTSPGEVQTVHTGETKLLAKVLTVS